MSLKRLMEHEMIPSWIMAVTSLCWILVGATAGAGGISRPGIRFDVEQIRYEGDSAYRVELRFENETKAAVQAGSFVNEFSVQSEIIGQWIPLTVRNLHGKEAGAAAGGPGLREVRVVAIRIPLNLPGLYRNMDGEINLRIVSRLAGTRDSAGMQAQVDGERYYWVSPESSQWILREGM